MRKYIIQSPQKFHTDSAFMLQIQKNMAVRKVFLRCCFQRTKDTPTKKFKKRDLAGYSKKQIQTYFYRSNITRSVVTP